MRTGANYLKSLRNRRSSTYIGGERIDDVISHPAFSNAARTVAKLYDVTADPTNADALTFTEDNERFSNIWLLPRDRKDLDARSRVHHAWARVTWGLFGRSPDHVAGWISGMACCPEILDVQQEGFADHVRRYYALARERDLFVAYAIIPPAESRAPIPWLRSNRVRCPAPNGERMLDCRLLMNAITVSSYQGSRSSLRAQFSLMKFCSEVFSRWPRGRKNLLPPLRCRLIRQG